MNIISICWRCITISCTAWWVASAARITLSRSYQAMLVGFASIACSHSPPFISRIRERCAKRSSISHNLCFWRLLASSFRSPSGLSACNQCPASSSKCSFSLFSEAPAAFSKRLQCFSDHLEGISAPFSSCALLISYILQG